MVTWIFAIKISLLPNPLQTWRALYAIGAGRSVENLSAKVVQRDGVKTGTRERN